MSPRPKKLFEQAVGEVQRLLGELPGGSGSSFRKAGGGWRAGTKNQQTATAAPGQIVAVC